MHDVKTPFFTYTVFLPIPRPSTSTRKFRNVMASELLVRILASEFPLDGALLSVSILLPSIDFTSQGLPTGDAPVQTLVGADADLTIFDAARIQDRATYEKPAVMSEGVRFVLIGGEVVVSDGKVVESARAGQAIRGAVQ